MRTAASATLYVLPRPTTLTRSTAPPPSPGRLLPHPHQVDCVLLLLQRGAPPGCRDALGRTALMLSLEHGRTECVEALLPRAASPDLKDAAGLPCLHRAAARGLSACVRLLLDARASVDMTDAEAHTPLHAACAAGEPVAALLLLEHSAEGVITREPGRDN